MTLKEIIEKVKKDGPVRAYFTMWGEMQEGAGEVNRGDLGDLYFDKDLGLVLKIDRNPDLEIEIEYAPWVHAPSIEHYSWEYVEYS